MDSPTSFRKIRFADYAVDLRTGEVLKSGQPVRLQDKPFQILVLLLEHPGDLVTREELRQALWAADTFVDFDVGLNTAIRKLRDALGDSADHPRFVETLPRRGYRFIADVERDAPQDSVVAATTPLEAAEPTPVPPKKSRLRTAYAIAFVVALVTIGWIVLSLLWKKPSAAGIKIQSIAVLPLDNLTGDPAQEYFADGMTDALITDLAKIGSLRVISRTSAMHYKDVKRRLPEIARELNVQAVVEGSVVRSGDKVRITAQLIYIPTDQHLWANSYERDTNDIVALQTEVARDIAQQIRSTITPQEEARVSASSRCTPQAHDLVLQGLYHWYKTTPDDYEKMRQYLEQALALDPSCARAHVLLAYYYGTAADEGLQPPQQAMARNRAEMEKAQQLDPTLAEPHISRGLTNLMLYWNWSEAEKELKKALELNPNWSDAYREYAAYLRVMGRLDEAIESARRGQDLDPLSASMSASVGWNYFYARRWDDAIAQFKKAIGMDAGFIAGYEGLAKCYEHKGMEADALRALVTEMEKAGAKDVAEMLRQENQRGGYRNAVRKLYRLKLNQFQQASRTEYVSPFVVANLYALLEDREQTFAWLEKSYEERSSNLIYLKADPDFDSVRPDPRFELLARRIGLP